MGAAITTLIVFTMASILVLAGFSTILNEKAYAGFFTEFGDIKCWLTANRIPVTVTLGIEDQFGTIENSDWRQVEYCTAAEKNGNPSPFSPELNQHYQGWLYPEFLIGPGTGQTVIANVAQFGTFTTVLGDLEQITVPATKFFVFPPLLPEDQVDSVDNQQHWSCYNISGVPAPEVEPITLRTQHGTQLDGVLEPFLFCTPIIKTNPAGQPFGALIDEHMVCYRLEVLEDVADGSPLPVALADQLVFEGIPFEISIVEKICAPATKTFPTVGGSMIPIDSVALLLAGVQSISMWMIPVVVAGVGISIFVAIRRK